MKNKNNRVITNRVIIFWVLLGVISFGVLLCGILFGMILAMPGKIDPLNADDILKIEYFCWVSISFGIMGGLILHGFPFTVRSETNIRFDNDSHKPIRCQDILSTFMGKK